jgi:hypothetical protein
MTPIQRLARMRESFETSKSLSFDEPRLTGYLRGVRLALSRNRISKGEPNFACREQPIDGVWVAGLNALSDHGNCK